MTLASSTSSTGTVWPSWVLVVAAVLVSGLLLAGPALRRRYPVAWWLLLGFPVMVVQVVRIWRPLMAGCGTGNRMSRRTPS